MRLLADAWVQAFGGLAVLSAALAVYPRLAGAPRLHRPPKTPGQWLVDARQASDSDTARLGEAVEAASEGETIFVRAGVYRESLALSRSVKLIGLGDSPAAVVIEAAGEGPGLRFSSGHALLQNLTVRGGAPAIEARAGARLDLRKVSLMRAQGGLLVRKQALVRFESGEVIGHKGCGLELAGGSVLLRSVSVSLNDCGVHFDGGGSLDAEDSDFGGNVNGPVLHSPGDRARISLRGARNKPRDFDQLVR